MKRTEKEEIKKDSAKAVKNSGRGLKKGDAEFHSFLLDYKHNIIPKSGHNRDHVALPGAIEKMRQWEMRGCRIIIITGRRESERTRTIKELQYHNIPYDMLIMGFADTGRVLINDIGSHGQCKAHAVSLSRNQGFNEYNWDEVGL